MLADLGRPVPGHAARSGRACTSSTCCPVPVLIGHADRRAPRAGRGAPPHPVPREPAAHRAAHRRRAAVPRPGAALARADVLRRRRPVPARRARPDQPDLAVGAVPAWLGDQRRPARLVSRLADRRAAADARLRRRHRPLHPDPEPVLGRRAVPAGSCSGVLFIWPPWVERRFTGDRARPQPAPTGRATRPGARRSAWRFCPGCSSSSPSAPPTGSSCCSASSYNVQLFVFRVGDLGGARDPVRGSPGAVSALQLRGGGDQERARRSRLRRAVRRRAAAARGRRPSEP